MKSKINIFIHILLIVSYSYSLYHIVIEYGLGNKNQMYFGAFFIVGSFIIHKYVNNNGFWATYKHELIHKVFTVLTFNKPTSLSINKNRGVTGIEGKYINNYLIGLSPYFFPIISIYFILFSFLFNSPKIIFYAFLGIVFSYDMNTIIKDIHPQQTDFNPFSKFFNLVIISFGMLFYMGIVYSFVVGGNNGMYKYITGGFMFYYKLI